MVLFCRFSGGPRATGLARVRTVQDKGVSLLAQQAAPVSAEPCGPLVSPKGRQPTRWGPAHAEGARWRTLRDGSFLVGDWRIQGTSTAAKAVSCTDLLSGTARGDLGRWSLT